MGNSWTSTDFERYILGNMPDEELQSFENQLLKDPGLKEEFELYRDTRDVLQEMYNQNVLADIRAIDREFHPAAPARSRKLWKRTAAAAAIIVLVAAGVWTWGIQHYDREHLAQKFSGPTMVDTWRSGDAMDASSIAATLNEADILFRSGDFARAAPLYRKVSGAETTRSEYASWQLVLCLMAMDTESSAFRDSLDKIVGDPNHLYHKDAQKLRQMTRSIFFDR